MSTVVIYHGDCHDGFCAAWLFHHAFPDAQFHSAHYGTEPPALACDKNCELYIVDFSYLRNTMFELAAFRKQSMVVLDHHQTARQNLDGLDIELASNNCGNALDICFDMNKSGARLAWEYLYNKQLLPDDIQKHDDFSLGNAPWLIDYTEDRDLWRWRLPQSREINAALRSYPLNFVDWDVLQQRSLNALALEGESILRYQQQIIDDHVKHARVLSMDGHEILYVNATVLFSEIAGELARGHPFGACYFDRQDGKRQWSLRSTSDGVDVSEIAKQHNGGGHKHAAGFEQSTGESS